MKAKTKIGMGMKTKVKTKKKTKRVLPTAKRGGILPIFPMLGALGSLIGGAAGVAKAVSDSKATRRQLEELQSQSRNGRSRIVSCSIQIWKGIISRSVQTWTGCNNKEKKKR